MYEKIKIAKVKGLIDAIIAKLKYEKWNLSIDNISKLDLSDVTIYINEIEAEVIECEEEDSLY